jgi:ankyrin
MSLLDNIVCPITHNIFLDPVIAPDGFVYEREAITAWMEKNSVSPWTNEKLSSSTVYPARVIKTLTIDYLEKNPNKISDQYTLRDVTANEVEHLFANIEGFLAMSSSQIKKIFSEIFSAMKYSSPEFGEKMERMFNNEIVARYIISAINDLTFKCMGVYSLLHLICIYCEYDLVRFAFENNPDIAINLDEEDSAHCTGIFYAVTHMKLEGVEYLLSKRPNVTIASGKGMTVLHMALTKFPLHIIKSIIELGADINSKSNIGTKPIHFACKNASIDILSYLKELGISFDVQNNNGYSPLIMAIENNTEEVINYILDQQVNINCQTSESNSAIDYAITRGFTATISRLIKMGANVNYINGNGCMPLHDTIQKYKKNDPIILELLSVPQDIMKSDAKGNTALKLACELSTTVVCDKIIDMLDGVIANADIIVGLACMYQSDTSIIKLIDKLGYDIAVVCLNTVDTKGYSPLHHIQSRKFSDKNRYLALVAHLIKFGADIELTSSTGKTALHYACKNQPFECIKYLVDIGANLEATTTDGLKPIQYICKHSTSEALQYLLSKGASIKCLFK